ncbi:type I-E CRISPR-associated protein Cse1/CasA [Schaalia sp. lx-260]|uniref:type I-E CRISPR-associated protein Cse1/CasA n=1 Tax=Schaalia sp. lx-260 TaxID=2899082 RepID=UPI001E4CBF50|nr:type I-E CRISPR-associated protein Cse1/CasA [Schaalia sp. lx-260]MCD4550380.1 type I-E CRISPR-associated protein Cse1/CasA [Schaalia sp. lx-260]
MMEQPYSFSLITEPWVQVTDDKGKIHLASLRNIFDGTMRIRCISGDNSLQDYAIFRLLLVIFWCAHRQNPDLLKLGDSEEWWENQWEKIKGERKDEIVLNYLEQWADRFDLFHPLTPFMQVANLATSKKDHKEIKELVPEYVGKQFALRQGVALEALTPAEAARWLICAQSYDPSGIKSGAVGDPRVKGGKGYPIGRGWTGLTGGILIHGENMNESLLLNTVPGIIFDDEDLPVWERTPDTEKERAVSIPKGPCDLLTWQARRIRLFTDEEGKEVTGVLLCNGDRIPGSGANIFHDPMTPYRYSANKSTATQEVFYPRPHDEDLTLWRSLDPLLIREGKDIGIETAQSYGKKKGKDPRAAKTMTALADKQKRGGVLSGKSIDIQLISAIYNKDASSLLNIVDLSLSFPVDAFAEEEPRLLRAIVRAASLTRTTSVYLGQYAGRLIQAAGGKYAYQKNVAAAFLDSMTPLFMDWMRNLTEGYESVNKWSQNLENEVLIRSAELIRQSGTRALIGRDINENEGKTRFISAGSAQSTLKNQLRKLLPHHDNTQEETHGN